MTLVKERQHSSPKIRPLSPVEADLVEARKGMSQLESWLEQKKTELEQSTVPCVTCGKTAVYTRQAGWLQGIHHIFTCPDDHESPYRLNGGKLEVYRWLIDQRKKGKPS